MKKQFFIEMCTSEKELKKRYLWAQSAHIKVNKSDWHNTDRQLGAFRKGRTVTTVLLFFQAILADKSSGVTQCHIHTIEEEDSEAVDLGLT
jgi:hypothetical protein